MPHFPYEAMEPDDVTAIDMGELMRAIERCAGARVKDEIQIIVRANAPDGPPSYGASVTDADGTRTFKGTGVITDILAWLLENHDAQNPADILELAWMVGDKEIAVRAVKGEPLQEGGST